jgi:hypothetical protein
MYLLSLEQKSTLPPRYRQLCWRGYCCERNFEATGPSSLEIPKRIGVNWSELE